MKKEKQDLSGRKISHSKLYKIDECIKISDTNYNVTPTKKSIVDSKTEISVEYFKSIIKTFNIVIKNLKDQIIDMYNNYNLDQELFNKETISLEEYLKIVQINKDNLLH